MCRNAIDTHCGVACNLRPDGRLQVVARRIVEECADVLESDLVRDEPFPWMRGAREEREGGAHGAGRVVERASQRQLLVMNAKRVEGDLGPARQAAERDDRAAGPDERRRVAPAFLRACRLDRDVRVGAVAGTRTEVRGALTPLR